MGLPEYDVDKLIESFREQRCILFAARENDPTSSHVIDAYKMRACLMSLDTLELVAIDTSYIVKPTGEPNTAYNSVFNALSSVGRALTCAGFEMFYIPRRKGQTMPPDEIRVFDPTQENPAYHLASVADIESFKEELWDMCEDLE